MMRQLDFISDHIANIPYVVIDTETTGLNPGTDRVVEIAAVRFKDGHALERFETFVDPGIPIPPEASAIHGITDAMVYTAPCMAVIEARLQAFVSDTLIVAHNAPFDKSFLPMLKDHIWACSHRLSRHLWPNAPSHKNQTLRYWLGINAPELNGFGAHRSTGDALVTGHIFQREIIAYLDRLGPNQYADATDLVGYIEDPVQVTTFNYGRKHRRQKLADIPVKYLQWVTADAASDAATRSMHVDPDTLAAVREELNRRAA